MLGKAARQARLLSVRVREAKHALQLACRASNSAVSHGWARGSCPELFLSWGWKAFQHSLTSSGSRISLGEGPEDGERKVWLEGMFNLLPQARHCPVLWGHQVVRQVSSPLLSSLQGKTDKRLVNSQLPGG